MVDAGAVHALAAEGGQQRGVDLEHGAGKRAHHLRGEMARGGKGASAGGGRRAAGGSGLADSGQPSGWRTGGAASGGPRLCGKQLEVACQQHKVDAGASEHHRQLRRSGAAAASRRETLCFATSPGFTQDSPRQRKNPRGISAETAGAARLLRRQLVGVGGAFGRREGENRDALLASVVRSPAARLVRHHGHDAAADVAPLRGGGAGGRCGGDSRGGWVGRLRASVASWMRRKLEPPPETKTASFLVPGSKRGAAPASAGGGGQLNKHSVGRQGNGCGAGAGASGAGRCRSWAEGARLRWARMRA